jgi:hypothetical protein
MSLPDRIRGVFSEWLATATSDQEHNSYTAIEDRVLGMVNDYEEKAKKKIATVYETIEKLEKKIRTSYQIQEVLTANREAREKGLRALLGDFRKFRGYEAYEEIKLREFLEENKDGSGSTV